MDPDRPESPPAGRRGGANGPIDDVDPRFTGARPPPVRPRERALVATRGPGPSREDPRVRLLRVALPGLFAVAVLAVAAVFMRSLAPPPGAHVVGPEREVREAVADRPYRVCRDGGLPCAWITVVDGRLLALDTSGPLREEFGRLAVAWCPSSGHFGSNVTGSRYDQAGNPVDGPAPRGLDRFTLSVRDGVVIVDFFRRTTGRQVGRQEPTIPPEGPDCDPIPHDWDADLRLPSERAAPDRLRSGTAAGPPRGRSGSPRRGR